MEPAEQTKATPQLDNQDFALAEQVRNIWRAEVAENLTRAEITNPAFWAHIATRARPYDEILVIRKDGTLFARMLVLQSERTWVRLHTLEWHDLTTRDISMSQAANEAHRESPPADAKPDPASQFRIEYKGQRMKWCVIRNADGGVTHEGIASKKEAQNELDQYIRTIAATV